MPVAVDEAKTVFRVDITDLGWDDELWRDDRGSQPLLHRIRHADHARSCRRRRGRPFPSCAPTGSHSSPRSRRSTTTSLACRKTRRSWSASSASTRRQSPGASCRTRRLPAVGRLPQQPHDRAAFALDRRLLGIVRFRRQQGAAELLPLPARAAERLRRFLHRLRLRARRRRDHLQPAERPAGLLPDRRARQPPGQGADQHRAGPLAARPGGDQRHLLHELPRQGHAAERRPGPRLCA